MGLTKSDEPFSTLVHQGTITNQGAKMSKSKGNIVNPDEFIDKYGSDVFRMYLMFMGPFEMGGDWSDKGITGTERFVSRMYEFFSAHKGITNNVTIPEKFDLASLNNEEKIVYRKTNQTIKKYEIELENLRFNTAIAALMELSNEVSKNFAACRKELQAYVLERFAVMLAPLAPHFAEEGWEMIGRTDSLFQNPVYFAVDADALIEDTANIALQINGKLRGTVQVPLNSEQQAVKEIAFELDSILRHVEGKTIIKEIFVKNKILNIVVK